MVTQVFLDIQVPVVQVDIQEQLVQAEQVATQVYLDSVVPVVTQVFLDSVVFLGIQAQVDSVVLQDIRVLLVQVDSVVLQDIRVLLDPVVLLATQVFLDSADIQAPMVQVVLRVIQALLATPEYLDLVV